MCGRYSLATPVRALAERFSARAAAALAEAFQPSFNIAPTTDVVGLAVDADGARVLDTYRWGLVPWWAADPSVGNRMFNARCETLLDSRAFGTAARLRRLVIPADGFFEWRDKRQPLFFHRADGAPLVFAGLWETWGHGDAPRLHSCTMITTAAGPDLEGVHDRMPVILEPDVLEMWLDPSVRSPDEIEGVLRPAPAGTLVHHPVDPRVGNVDNDWPDLVVPFEADPDCVQATQAGPEPLTLFG